MALSLILSSLGLAGAVRGAPSPGAGVPREVIREVARLRADAERRSVLLLSRGELLPPLPDASPPEDSGRNPVSVAFALATGSPEGLYQAALGALLERNLEEAAYRLVRVRELHPGHPRAREAAFWLGEIRRRQGRRDEAVGFLRLVSGERAQEGAYRLARLLDGPARRDEARSLWKKVSAETGNPYRAEALLWLGWDALVRNDVPFGRASLEQAVAAADTGPGHEFVRTSVLFGLAVARWQLGDLPFAEKALARVLLEAPDHPVAPAATLALGWVLVADGKAREAETRFSRLAETAGNTGFGLAARYARARLAAQHGRFDAAAESFDGGSDAFWAAAAGIELGWKRLEAGQLGPALASFQRAAEGSPEDVGPLARYLSGECLYRLSRHAEAADALEQVPDTSGLRAPALDRAGSAALRSGSPRKALALFGNALASFPAYSAADGLRVGLGDAHLALGELPEALEAFRGVHEESPWWPDALHGKASALLGLERWAEAGDLFAEAVSLLPAGPRRESALLSLARARFHQKVPAAALEALGAIDEASAPPVLLERSALRGLALAELGQTEEARRLLTELLKAPPPERLAAEAHEALARLDLGAGDAASALGHLEAVVALAPEAGRARARGRRAELLFRVGRYADALSAYGELEGADAARGRVLSLARLGRLPELGEAVAAFAARHPDDPRRGELFLLLGTAALEAGRPDEAATAFARAAALGGPTELGREARLRRARALAASGGEPEALAELQALSAEDGPLGLEALRELTRRLDPAASPEAARALWDRLADRAEGREKCLALRAAGRHALSAGTLEGAEERLRSALRNCPRTEVSLRQALLADLGEVLLRSGRGDQAVAALVEASEAALGPEGLRALELLADAWENAGRADEALETYLRMGYLYPPAEEPSAKALLKAAEILQSRGERARARSIYGRLTREAAPQVAAEAGRRLAGLGPAASGAGAEQPRTTLDPR